MSSQMEAVLRGGRSSREGELCVQAVFSLLDTLRLWLEDTRPALLANPGSSTSAPADAANLQALLAFVSTSESAHRQQTFMSSTIGLLFDKAFWWCRLWTDGRHGYDI